MTIAALAKAAGVGIETVRFYQRKGLLETPANSAGIRKYSDSHVRTIRFVKKIQELGFSLKDAAVFLELGDCCDETRPRLVEVSNTKINEINQKITDLSRMVELLKQFLRTCGTDSASDSRCSLIDCFENNWECCDALERETK